MSDLREKVAEIIRKGAIYPVTSDELADAAIAIVRAETLEEAARECMADLPGEGGPMEDGYRLACEENARNIRALGEKWKCPINHPGCSQNCGSYGCGN